MSIEPRNITGNILIRHLHRHNQISTLFRSPEKGTPGGVVSRAGMGLTPAYSPSPLVLARLAIPGTGPVRGDLISTVPLEEEIPYQQEAPLGPAIEAEPADVTLPDVQDQTWARLDAIYHSQQEQVRQEQGGGTVSPSTPAPLPDLHRQTSAPAQAGGPVMMQPVKSAGIGQPPISQASVRPAAAPVVQPAPSVERRSDSKITDADWRRLEAISRAHEEQEQRDQAEAKEKAQKTPEPKPSVQASPASTSRPVLPPPFKSIQEYPSPIQATKPVTGKLLVSDRSTIEKASLSQPPIPPGEELPSVEEKPTQVSESPLPAAPQSRPSPVQRAWQGLQNIFGKRAESETPAPGIPSEQAALQGSEPVADEKPPQEDLQLKPSEKQALPLAPRQTKPVDRVVEQKPLSHETSIPLSVPPVAEQPVTETAIGDLIEPVEAGRPALTPATRVEKSAGESELQAEAESDEEALPAVEARLVNLESHPGEPMGAQTSTEQPKIVQTKAVGGPEPTPGTTRVYAPMPAPQPLPLIPIETTGQAGTEPFEDAGEPEPVETTAAEELREQSLPLEQAWPVERLEPGSPVHVERVEASPATIPDQPVGSSIQETAEVHRLLQDVQPGQPSDSKLEVISPRRPRLAVPPVEEGVEQGEAPGEAEAAQVEPPPIQRSLEGETTSVESVSPASAPAGLNSELAHLWGLLDGMQSDQSSPASHMPEGMPGASRPASMSHEASSAIQRAEQPPRPAESPIYKENFPLPESPEEDEGTTSAETPLVQRQAAPAASANPPTAEAGEAGGSAGKPDIDELARQVYAEVRRKLALEWERMRR